MDHRDHEDDGLDFCQGIVGVAWLVLAAVVFVLFAARWFWIE